MRLGRYEPGTQLQYEVTSVAQGSGAEVKLVVDEFVGGGFAGQVYRVKLLDIQGEPVDGLEAGGVYAMKILVPPSRFSLLFRNVLYWIGFQGPFQLQVNPAAARAGALWQKFIRRAAKYRFGDDRAVADIYATFVDQRLGSCGELSEWVDGRTWRLEVDDRMDLLKRWCRGKVLDASAEAQLGSPEYRAKRRFMREFVRLLYDVGAYEFARQYEWSTCKSQPNCLKRRDTEDDPQAGLTAVDFRAGLALLPFLPMSPGDFKLIFKGLLRGSLVQFDRGDLGKLEAFVAQRPERFADMRRMLEELREDERIYRDSLPDITHNHVRLLYSRRLWSTILDSAVTGWRVRNLVDRQHEASLRRSSLAALVFFVVGVIPFLGKLLRRIWASGDWRRHYAAMVTGAGYLRRAVYGRVAEKLIAWHRAGRVDATRALQMAASPSLFFAHVPLSILPAPLHRFLTDRRFRKEKLVYIFVRPVRLYFNRQAREQWLREMVQEGRNKQMLSEQDAQIVLSQLNEPFIQKYLKSLAVHVCTLPVTQIVSVAIAVVFVLTHPEMPRKQAWGIGAGIVAAFQVTPISPGSLVRGLYVLYLVIRERNFKDYNIAVFLGFFKYVGYLAFPIQMTYHYPVLARFMAAHWATDAAHIVPVFGERGALLEHWAFCLFYNVPLTLRRRMRRRAEVRAGLKPRYWHVGATALVGASLLTAAELVHMEVMGRLPAAGWSWWWPAVILPVGVVCSIAVTLGAGGAPLWKRIAAAVVAAVALAVLYSAAAAVLGLTGAPVGAAELAKATGWRVFVLAVLAPVAVFAGELSLPDPPAE